MERGDGSLRTRRGRVEDGSVLLVPGGSPLPVPTRPQDTTPVLSDASEVLINQLMWGLQRLLSLWCHSNKNKQTSEPISLRQIPSAVTN